MRPQTQQIKVWFHRDELRRIEFKILFELPTKSMQFHSEDLHSKAATLGTIGIGAPMIFILIRPEFLM